MKKILLTVISIAIAGSLFLVQAQDGFVVWSKGGGCERELHYNKITGATNVGPAQLVIKKGVGADIWPHISYDGEWIAWARATKSFSGRYGACDYHGFQNYDIYIGKIDFGKTLPVKGIKVAHGYFPSWGDDAKNPGKPKTLYFTHYESQTIKKTTINPDGSFTPPTDHHKFKQGMGTNAHIQMSPNGKFLLYRPGKIKVYSLELKKDICGSLGGCHPCWGPRSKYFIRSQNGAFFNTGTSVKSCGKAGVGSYFQGLSNDAYWDEGKLWVIGRIGGSGQNGAGSVEFTEVAIDGNGGWKLGTRTKVGSGSACDIHMFPKGFNPDNNTSALPNSRNLGDSKLSFTAQVKSGNAGLQLVILSIDKSARSAELFDTQGKRVRLLKMSSSMKNTMPLKGIGNGRYVLKVSGDNATSMKSIFISR